MYFPKWTQHQHDQPDLVILKHRTGPIKVVPLAGPLPCPQTETHSSAKGKFCEFSDAIYAIHSILSAGSEGNSRACTANAMGAEHAPSATGIVVHVPIR